MRSLRIHIVLVCCLSMLSSCATQSPDVDSYNSGTMAAGSMSKRSALPTLGMHKIAVIVRERPQAAFDYYGSGNSHVSYEVPQAELVPEGYLREQVLAALKQQSELQVTDRSEYAEDFARAATFGAWSNIYRVNPDTPAYAQLQSMHGEGIDAVLLILEHDRAPLRLWGPGHLGFGDDDVGPKGICFCPPGSRSDENTVAYDEFTAIIISTSDGKELDGRHYQMGSYVLLDMPWKAEYSRYSPQDVALMQQAVQEREHSNVLQILRTFKILPAVPSSNHR